MKRILPILILIILVTGSLTAKAKSERVELLGAGATFPYPLYSKMFDVYHKKFGLRINYQSIGSGGGQRQLLSETVDFGGSDAFMTDRQLEKAPAKILHIPTCLGAVAVTYNLPGNPQLRITQRILSAIFLGKVKKWNDSRIKKANPGIILPNANIIVVHRSDGSGTSFIFTDYLSKISKEWEQKVGRGKSVNWPVGLEIGRAHV